MQGSGVGPERVKEIRGYADTRLKYPQDPTDARNRRIGILVLNKQQPAPEGPIPSDSGATAQLSEEETAPPNP